LLSTLTAPCSTPKEKSRASTKEAISKALDRGVKVVLCSGRPIAGLAPYMNELGIKGEDQYALTLNGAISSKASGKS
jgi:hydroxymethylpyrimidine pyrophosphatase-like HAD family hydrolase